MLSDIASGCEVYLVSEYTDMRKGIDGLAAIVQGKLLLDPFSKALFLFCGRNRSKMKGLLWEGDGFLLLYKRLDNGCFRWPRNETEARKLTTQQIRWLMEGLAIEQPKAIKASKTGKGMKAEISTATLANWVIEASETYLKPIYQQLHSEILKKKVIHADETVVQVLHEENRKAKTQSRMWVYCTDKIKLYQYTQSRNGENAVNFLNGYTGYLVCDGYDGYNKLKDITRCGC